VRENLGDFRKSIRPLYHCSRDGFIRGGNTTMGFYNVHIHIYIFNTILNYQKKVKFLPILVSWQLNKADHDITEILLKVALNTITL
jgi:hypothetical protein